MKTNHRNLFLISALVISSLSLSAFAADLSAPGTAGHKDAFDQIHANFAVSSLPSIDSLPGLYAGRCYSSIAKFSAYGSLLVAQVVETGNEGGPMFPSEKVLKAYTLGEWGTDAAYFDHKTAKDLEPWLKQKSARLGGYSEVYESQGSLMSQFMDQNLLTRKELRIRALDGWLITETWVPYYNAKTPETVCYYFQQLH